MLTASAPAGDISVALATITKRLDQIQSKQGQQQAKAFNNKQQQQVQQSQPGVQRTVTPAARSSPYSRGGARIARRGGRAGGRGSGRPSACFNCGNPSHHYTACWSACKSCGQPGPVNGGHSTHQCPTGDGRPAQPRATANTAEGTEVTGTAFMTGSVDLPSPFLPPFDPAMAYAGPVYVGPSMHNDVPDAPHPNRGNVFNPFRSKGQWFLDSGASHHMTPCRAYLFDYVPAPLPSAVRGINGASLARVGKGTVRYAAMINGVSVEHELRDVWYVPGLPVSLLSTQHLARDRMWVTQGGPDDHTHYVVNPAGKCVLECPHTGVEGTLNIPSFKPEVNTAFISHWDLTRFPYHQCVNPALKTHPTPAAFVPPASSHLRASSGGGRGRRGHLLSCCSCI